MRERLAQEIMLLEGLYEEALGLPTDAEKVVIDDDAHKTWNHCIAMLKKDRLITAPTKKQIRDGSATPIAITAKGRAEYERIKGTPEHVAAVKWWTDYIGLLRAIRARRDSARTKG